MQLVVHEVIEADLCRPGFAKNDESPQHTALSSAVEQLNIPIDCKEHIEILKTMRVGPYSTGLRFAKRESRAQRNVYMTDWDR